MRVFDNFMFWNELDLLEIRLSEHYDQVDQFNIVESDHTFTGIYKGFILRDNLDRFDKWKDKINYIQAHSPVYSNPWDNEAWQRNQLKTAWDNVENDDVLLFTDIDEIIRPEAIQFVRETDYNFYGLGLPMFYFKFNYMCLNDNYPWRGLAYRGYIGLPNDMRFKANYLDVGSRIELHHAGWHFSCLGDDEALKHKLKSFSHYELNIPSIIDNIDIESCISRGKDFFREETIWGAVKFDNYFPKSIINNQEKYKDLIIQDASKSVQEYWGGKILEERK